MGLRDQITDLAGRTLGGVMGMAGDVMSKANGPRSDEPSDGIEQTSAMVAPGTGQADLPPEPSGQEPRGLLYDPFALIDQLGYRDRPSPLTYNTLREMAKRVPTYTGIIQTRMTQISSFGQRQEEKRDAGFGVVMRDHKAHPTPQDKIRMRELEDWLLQTGTTWSPGRDNFRTFLRKIARDSLDLDQCVFEIVRNRKGLPAEFYAMDAATIRLADVPPGAEAQQDPDQTKFVQVYDEIIITEYASHELCFGIRNPRTDIRVNGYGFSELEMIINTITAQLWAFEYNKRQFSQGALVNGVMNFKGTVPDRKLDAFRRAWKMMISGVSNAHRVPMTNVEELQWIDFQKNNRDMEYSAWMDFLIKITCAVMQFDPAEINFNYGNSGGGGQMFGTPVDRKLKESKDRGLRPLLKDIQNWINVHLIWPLDPYMQLKFFGLDAKDATDVVDMQAKEVKFKKTVDELRAEDDLEPLPNGEGAIILDPTFMQAKQAAAGMGGDGMPGEDGQENGNGATDGTNGSSGSNGDTGLTGMVSQDETDRTADLASHDFSDLFPEKSLKDRDELRKAGKARVRIIEIDL